jgi:hypothetical protein
MTEPERKLMQQYAITSEEKRVYHYMDFKYDRLDDALPFAKIDTKLKKETVSSKPTSSSR